MTSHEYRPAPFYGAGIRAWYARLGGKSRLAKRLYQLFPPPSSYTTYVEPFFGAGWVFFEKDPSPKEVINDLDPAVYYAMKDIQAVTQEELQDMSFPASKQRFLELKNSKPTNARDRLYRFLYLKWASFSGNMQTYHANQGATMERRKKQLIRRLPEIQKRLKGVVVLKQDYLKVMKKYQGDNTFFYLDPPYINVSTREYAEKSIDLQQLSDTLRNIKGKFMLSFNDLPEIRSAFQGFKIRKVQTAYKIGGTTRPIDEIIVTNY